MCISDGEPYPGEIAEDVDSPALRAWLLKLNSCPALEWEVREGMRIFRCSETPGNGFPMFGNVFEDAEGAKKAFRNAVRLAEAGVPVPRPVAWVRFDSGAVWVSEVLRGGVSFEAAWLGLVHEDPLCRRIMALLQRVADAVRAMHGAGFEHRGLDMRSVWLREDGEGGWENAWLLKVEKGRFVEAVSDRVRGGDVAGIRLPSDMERVFWEMLSTPDPLSDTFMQAVKRARRCLGRGCGEASGRVALSEKDVWIWDDRSMQAIPALKSRDKRKYYRAADGVAMAGASLRYGRNIRRACEALMAEAWTKPVELKGRLGLSINLEPERFDKERKWLTPLGALPLLVRLYHHESLSRQRYAVEAVRKLQAEGHRVVVALVQDRRAVRFPDKWADFVNRAGGSLSGFVEAFEVGHAVNRVKWGVWNLKEYQQLLAPFSGWRDRYPQIPLWGPAGIDFEFPRLLPFLDQVPEGAGWSVFSHHMYVDRRGAPENEQAGYDTVRKLAMGRAIARVHPACEERLVVSEVNWPLSGTGVWSPVGSPYQSPGPRLNDPSVDEETYAAYMVRYVLLALCSGMAERVYWWNLAAHGFGLIDDRAPAGWRPRPAYHAFKRLTELTNTATYLSKNVGETSKDWCLNFQSARSDMQLSDMQLCWDASGNESPL